MAQTVRYGNAVAEHLLASHGAERRVAGDADPQPLAQVHQAVLRVVDVDLHLKVRTR